MKRTYEAPELMSIGSFEALTQSNGSGTKLDLTFGAGTDISEITVGTDFS
jgi:hypothetical protein